MARISRRGALLALVAALAAPVPSAAYEERVHQLIGERALPATLPRDLARATPVDVDELRRATWRVGANHPDAAVRAAFLARYPAESSFDAWAWKEFLGLTPEARVVGVDVLPSPEPDARTVAALASRLPDDDKRNVERFAHDADRRVRRDGAGKPIPLAEAIPVAADLLAGKVRGRVVVDTTR